jgi:hypothetical protein
VQATLMALSGSETSAGQIGVGAATTDLAAWEHVLELVSGAFFTRSQPAWRDAALPYFWLASVAQLLFIAALAYALLALLRWWRQQRRQPLPPRLTAYLILAIWLLLPLLLYLRHTVYLQNYYFLYLLPAPFLLIAVFVDEAIRVVTSTAAQPLRLPLALLLLLPVLLLGLWQLHFDSVGLLLAETGQLRPARQARHVVAALARSREVLAQFPECELLVAGAGGTVESSPLGLLYEFLYPHPVRFVATGRGYIEPRGCAVYLVTADDPLLHGWLDDSAQLLPAAVETEEDTWRFYHVAGGTSGPDEAPLASWENGLELLQVRLRGEPASNRQLDYRWQVTRAPEAPHYHFFNHVLNEAGELVAQEDAPAIATVNWRPGDRLVTRFHVTLPALSPGRYTVQVGLYTWPDLVRVPLQGESTTTFPFHTFKVPGPE